ncbi:GGDEF domain-containing protein [uncultured Cohaesibacter sp.]|uniref:GGDEF domain-containing protein n=1 Tax=uncultured Cohaesibacter sp. TaxID=1002546 RepID=UPI0029C83873|nr:GGDEF domain-containing protein [uncultured Cohaesibacter sp.]
MIVKKPFVERNIGALVITACIGAFLALVFSNAYLLHRSSDIANNVQLAQEERLVRAAIKQQAELMALDQSQISNWSHTLDAITGEIDEEFVADEIADWLWSDFDILMSIIVSGDNTPVVTAYEDRVLEPEAGQGAIKQHLDLIERARQTYRETIALTIPPVTVFKRFRDPVRSRFPLYEWSLREVNGGFTIAMAQVIVPDKEGYDLGDNPLVFLTFKPITENMLTKLDENINLKDFHYSIDKATDPDMASVEVSKLPDGHIVYARWTPGEPSQAIWDQTLPTLTLPFIFTAVALGLIAWRFSHIVGALQESEEQNRFLALHDALTGLPNRLHFDRALERVIESGKEDRCAILCLDLDRFKAVNDTFGHEAGDVVLTSIAERIRDRVGSNGMAARVGGDEFIILLRKKLSNDDVMFLCDQLIEDVCLPILVPGGVAEVGASIGVAWWPDDALTVKSIIRSADEALYMSKQQGRGQVSCASRLRRVGDPSKGGKQSPVVDQMRDALSKSA